MTYSDAGHVLSYSDYFPFGLKITARSSGNEGYRYGFNGKERDDDIANSHYDFGARIYSPIIGRWLSPDPLEHTTPYYSTYQSFANSPISIIDPDGRSGIVTFDKDANGGKGEIVVSANIFFYGEGDTQLAVAVADNIQGNLNEAAIGYTMKIRGLDGEYPVRFEINGEFGTMEDAQNRIANDPANPGNNYIRFISKVGIGSEVRRIDDSATRTMDIKAGTNSGVFNIADLLDGQTISTHEFLHGLGYFNEGQINYGKNYVTYSELTKGYIKSNKGAINSTLQNVDGSHNNYPMNGIPTLMTQGSAIEIIQEAYMYPAEETEMIDSRKVKRDITDVSNTLQGVKVKSSGGKRYKGRATNLLFNSNGEVINK